MLSHDACDLRGGSYRGDGSTCEPPLCLLPLTPVIGVNPSFLEFGLLCPGQCRDGELTLRNAAPDPESELIIVDLVITPPFSLVDPPQTPFTIPGDGTLVPLTLRYCASGAGSQSGALTIHAQNASNSPLVVPLHGIADPPPECDHGGPYFGLPTQPITFDGSGSTDPGGTILSYRWDFGDGATATGPVVVHTYAAQGTYAVSLELTDDCGGVSTCQTTAHVSTNLPPICDAGGPYAGEVGVPIPMTGEGSSDPDGMIVTYRWNFGDGQTANGVNQNHTYQVPGIFTVTLTVIDNQAASTTCTTTAQVGSANTPPICDAGGPYSGVAGQPISFDGSGSSDDGTIVAYAWQFGDCGTGTGPGPTHTYATPGSYTVQLCVTDDGGATSCCTATAVVGTPSSPIRLDGLFGKGTPADRALGANPNIVLPLHAEAGCHGCGPLPVDCLGNRPTVNIPPNSQVTVYLMAFSYTALAGVQTAFDWDPSWILLGALFDCVPGQLTAVVPVPPGGPTAGTVATAFDCVTSGNLLVVGRLLMMAGPSGCVSQVQSTYPGGIMVVDCSLGTDHIANEQRLGSICVASGGHDACDIPIPVRPATWGQVKATYR
jgi:PKD repeat protein